MLISGWKNWQLKISYYELNTTIFDEMVMWIKQFGGKEDEK